MLKLHKPMQYFLTDEFSRDTYDWVKGHRHAHMEKYQYIEPNYSGDSVQCGPLWRAWEKIAGEGTMLKRQQNIIKTRAREMADLAGARGTIVDLGCGTAALTNALPFAEAFGDKANRYIGVDLNNVYAQESAHEIKSARPDMECLPRNNDFYGAGLQFPHEDDCVVLFMGGTIGNFEAEPGTPDAINLMARQISEFSKNFPKGTIAFIGLETTQNKDLLFADYGHPLHRKFETAVMHAIKRDVLSDQPGFEPEAWKYAMGWYPESYQFCHIAQATDDQSFVMFEDKIDISNGHDLLIDNSFKFTVPAMQLATERAGKEYMKAFTDDESRMAIHALRL